MRPSLFPCESNRLNSAAICVTSYNQCDAPVGDTN